jgi:regulator of replication initiation timing
MKRNVEKEVDRIERKVFHLERQSEKLVAVNGSLRRKNKELLEENLWLTQENATRNKRYSKKKTKPSVMRMVYEGYTGTAIGAGDIFIFRTVERWKGDDEGFVALDMNGFSVSKHKTHDGWNKVRIVVDILPNEED